MNKNMIKKIGLNALEVIPMLVRMIRHEEDKKAEYDKGYNQGYEDYRAHLIQSAKEAMENGTDYVFIPINDQEKVAIRYEKSN